MFATYHSLEVAPPCDTPGVNCWRAVELMGNRGWLVVTFTLSGDDHKALHTVLLTQDVDLVVMVEGPMQAAVKSVDFVLPARGDPRRATTVQQIEEVWLGQEAEGGREVVILRAVDGDEFYGPLGLVAPIGANFVRCVVHLNQEKRYELC